MRLLLNEDVDDKRCDTHPLFNEIVELVFDGDEVEWRETARWVKFEENVEIGGKRWSKPHVATLAMNSLFELRRLFINGTVILDVRAHSIEGIVDILLDSLVNDKALSVESLGKVKELLLKKHKHLHKRKQYGLTLCRPQEVMKGQSTSIGEYKSLLVK